MLGFARRISDFNALCVVSHPADTISRRVSAPDPSAIDGPRSHCAAPRESSMACKSTTWKAHYATKPSPGPVFFLTKTGTDAHGLRLLLMHSSRIIACNVSTVLKALGIGRAF
eukprot:Blabericola_migrator_1__3784@NODE_2137_length_3221_cov_11_319277_g1353_i0_p3_GENE_NODE_2137_length_3221_cov_11_319277_g1353_i0NODE_2137_length_3221_cov_11_319277_g1353_i0_p3_ORF_typecomplete_len113_score3_51_NODE_2137_length_3221_cov_11_319277_g1353_i018302168